MKIITISREFGSGGRELGRHLAEVLHMEYYDSEIITAVAENSGLDRGYVAKALDGQGWQSYPVSLRLASAGSLQTDKIQLLLQQKQVLEEIGAQGKDCVIVGRNADMILRQYEPFRIFVCAESEAKLARCRERAPAGENLTDKELLRRMKQIDKARAATRELLSGEEWGRKEAYHLTVNTTDWEIKELAGAVGEMALRWFGRAK